MAEQGVVNLGRLRFFDRMHVWSRIRLTRTIRWLRRHPSHIQEIVSEKYHNSIMSESSEIRSNCITIQLDNELGWAYSINFPRYKSEMAVYDDLMIEIMSEDVRTMDQDRLLQDEEDYDTEPWENDSSDGEESVCYEETLDEK